MKWTKLKNWLPEIEGFTHAANPTHHQGRVFFSPRNSLNQSHVYYAHFDPVRLQLGGPLPLFGPGRMGSFDDSGCSVCQVTDDSVLYLGWNLGVTVPFRNTLALWNRRGGRSIVKQRDEIFLSISYGWRDGGRLFYHAIHSFPMGTTELIGEPGLFSTHIMCRPCVLGDEMWFCYRSADGQYRIGYAKLRGGAWSVEPSGIEPSGEGFERIANAYPCVFDHEGSRYMLYNGDGYGKTGFGLAILEQT